MQLSSSTFLTEKRPLLKQLVAELDRRFEYSSVLAADNRAYRYGVSRQGVTAGSDPMFSERGFVARVYTAGSYAEYSFNAISEEEIPCIVSKIEESLVPLKDSVPESVSVFLRARTEEEPASFVKSTEYEIHPKDLGDAEVLKKLGAIREKGLSLKEGIVDVMVNSSWQEIHKVFISGKKDLEQNILWASASIAALATAGRDLKTSHSGHSILGGIEVIDMVADKIGEVVDTAVELLQSEPLVPGEYECICTPSVTGMIVHEAFGHGVEMDMFVKDRALAKSFVGQQVASPLVSMHDTSCNARNTATYFFDDEGTPANDTLIIDHGILKAGISDVLSAGALGTVPTGNGRRESFERKAYTRMTNTYFEGGTDSVEDMIASVKDGLLLDQPSSGMEDPKNWGIQCMVSFAREIKDGKLTGRIFSPIVLTGYVPDLLKSISMMSPVVELEGGGMCGKGWKEWVKVSDGGPYIKARIRLG